MISQTFSKSFGFGRRTNSTSGQVARDPLFHLVTASLHFEGTNQSTVIVDEKSKTWTVGGDAKLTNLRSKYGTTSIYFDGLGDEISCTDPYLAAGTISVMEGWVFLESTSDGGPLFGQGHSVSNSNQFLQVNGSTRSVRFYKGSYWSSGIVTDVSTPNNVVPLNEWVHIALVLAQKQVRIYVNGTLQVSRDTNNAFWSYTVEPFRIGRHVVRTQEASQTYFKGYVDDVRITNGNERYKENFTPSRNPDLGNIRVSNDPYINDVVSLMYFQGPAGTQTFTDEFDLQWITYKTDTTIRLSSEESKFGSTSLELIDGGDLVLSNPLFLMRNNPYTIECWVKLAQGPASGQGHGLVHLGSGVDGSSGVLLRFFNNNGGTDVFLAQTSNTQRAPAGPDYSTSTMPLPWVHIAAVSDGSVIRMFHNGIPSSTTVPVPATSSFRMRLNSNDATSENFDKRFFLGGLRITRGVARYTQSFDPETAFTLS